MRYINAAAILPEDLIEKLQDFVQGEYLYIPAKKGQRKNWGEVSGYRKEIDKRNSEIMKAYASGSTIEELAEAFFLSIYTIRKIIYKDNAKG